MLIYTGDCVVCGAGFSATRRYPAERKRETCSRSCSSRIAAAAPSTLICACGKAASKRGYCPDCSHVRKLESRNRHYAAHREQVAVVNRERYAHRSVEWRAAEALRLRELKFNGHWQEVLERDGYRCQKCGSTKQLVVHHLIFKDDSKARDSWSEADDLITLCRSCHLIVHLH